MPTRSPRSALATATRTTTTVVVAVLVLAVATPATAARRCGDLHASMKNADVAVVPPRTINIRGESMATLRHNPLGGYVHTEYPAQFGELAADLLSGSPTRWQVTALIPEDMFYHAVETDDPDNDEPSTLPELPSQLQGHDFVAVFRYAEFAYGIIKKPHWTKQNQIVMEQLVNLELDLQLVVYDGHTGEPLGVFDALQEVEVPEIQSKATRSKAYYRATVGALRRVRQVVRKEG